MYYDGCCPECLGPAAIEEKQRYQLGEYCDQHGWLPNGSVIWLKTDCCHKDLRDLWAIMDRGFAVAESNNYVVFQCGKCGSVVTTLTSHWYRSPCCLALLRFGYREGKRALWCRECDAECSRTRIPYRQARQIVSEQRETSSYRVGDRVRIDIDWPQETPAEMRIRYAGREGVVQSIPGKGRCVVRVDGGEVREFMEYDLEIPF